MSKRVADTIEQVVWLNIRKFKPVDFLLVAVYLRKIRVGGTP